MCRDKLNGAARIEPKDVNQYQDKVLNAFSDCSLTPAEYPAMMRTTRCCCDRMNNPSRYDYVVHV